MQNPSKVTQESIPAFSLITQLCHFAFNKSFHSSNPDGFCSLKPNYMYFLEFRGSISQKRFGRSISQKRRRVIVVASLTQGARNSASSSLRSFIAEFNRAIKLHCARLPLGFVSVRICSNDSNGLRRWQRCSEVKGLPLNGVKTDGPKKVLILMSDTGGGHKVSAEAFLL